MMLSVLFCLLGFVFGCQSTDNHSANPTVSSESELTSTYASNEPVYASPGYSDEPLFVDTISFDTVLIVYNAGVDDGTLLIDYAYDYLGLIGPRQQMSIGLDGSSFELLDEFGRTVYGYSCSLQGSTEMAHIQLDTVAINMYQDTSQVGTLRIGVESGIFADEVTFASAEALDTAAALYEEVLTHPAHADSLSERELQLLAQADRIHSWAPHFEQLLGDKAITTNLDLIYSDNLRAWLSDQPEFGDATSIQDVIRSICGWARVVNRIMKLFGQSDSTIGMIVQSIVIICDQLHASGIF